MSLKAFDSLLEQSKKETSNDVLMMLFANAKAETSTAGKKQSGTIRPVMCVDKKPKDIASFKSLLSEADGISKDWNFVIVASLAGVNGKAPISTDVEKYLNKMVYDVENGASLGNYAIFDREQNPVFISQ